MPAAARMLPLVLLLAAAASCTADGPGTPTASRRASPGELTVGITAGVTGPASLLPGDLRDSGGRLVASALWSGLVELDAATGKPVPVVAESITSRDQRTWTIRIRPGWRFHDGSAVTARSFADAWQAAVDEGWRGSSLLTDALRVTGAAAAARRPGQPIPGIAAPDPLTLRVRLDRPASQFPVALSAPALLPLPDQVLRSRDWEGFQARPVGNGPFRMAERYQPGTPLRVVRNPDYAGARHGDGPGRAEAVEFRIYPGAEAQYRDLESGLLDLATDVPPERHDRLERQFAGRHLAVPVPEITYLGFPLWDARYRNPGVRHAFSLALERISLAEAVLGHRATPATAMIPPAVALGRREAPCRVCQHDAEAARSLLLQSGWAPGNRVTVWHEAGTVPADAARALAAQLRSVLGLRDVAPRAVEPDRYRQALARREPDGPFLVTVSLRYAGQADLLGPAGPGAVAGVTGYRDGELDLLVAEAGAAPSVEVGALRYRLAENVLLRDLPLVPLWSPHTHLVWSARVTGVTADPYAGVRLDRVRTTAGGVR